jgi:hypothetical protein
MKRFRHSGHYLSAPTTQGQSLVGLTELKAPGALPGTERSPFWSVPPLLFFTRLVAGFASLTSFAFVGVVVSRFPNGLPPVPLAMLYFEVCPHVAYRHVEAARVFGSAIGPGAGYPCLSALYNFEGELSQIGISGRRAIGSASMNGFELAKSG